MPKKSKIVLGVLNVVAHPHPPGIYRTLFQQAFDAHQEVKRAIPIRGDIRALFRSCHPWPSATADCQTLEGEVIRFLEIGSDEPWFNLKTADAASDSELSQIKIPEGFRPKMQRIRYVFYLDTHRLVYTVQWRDWAFGRTQLSGLSPRAMCSVVDTLFANHSVNPNTGNPTIINVSIEQDHSTIDKILSMHSLQKLEIQVTRPNADDEADWERSVMERMDLEHVRTKEVNLESDGRPILPSIETRQLAIAAKSNGYAKAKGRDIEKNKIELDTRDNPLKREYFVDSDMIVFNDWLRETGRKLVGELKEKEKTLAEKMMGHRNPSDSSTGI
jgi:hypothetical protein